MKQWYVKQMFNNIKYYNVNNVIYLQNNKKRGTNMINDFINDYYLYLLKIVDDHKFQRIKKNRFKTFRIVTCAVVLLNLLLLLVAIVLSNKYATKKNEIYNTYYIFVGFVFFIYVSSYLNDLFSMKKSLKNASLKAKIEAMESAIDLSFNKSINDKEFCDFLISAISEHHTLSNIFFKNILVFNILPTIVINTIGILTANSSLNNLLANIEMIKDYYVIFHNIIINIILELTRKCVELNFSIILFPSDYLEIKHVLNYATLSTDKLERS